MSDAHDETPFESLSPDVVLDALDARGWRTTGQLLALNSFENRVYQITLEDGDFVVAKFYRPGRWSTEQIQEEHDFLAELVATELPCVAPLARDGNTLFDHGEYRFAVYPRRGGQPPDLEVPGNLAVLGRTLARMHNVGAARPFASRIRFTWQRWGRDSREWLLASPFVPDELRPAFESLSRDLLVAVEDIMTSVPAGDLRIHGDCHLGNLLWRDGTPHFVDFDDTVNGPAIQDLWMLLSDGEPAMVAELLDAYDSFRAFDARELQLVEALRTLRIMYHAAWIGRRWHDPAFPPAFPYFEDQRFWSDHVLTLREQAAKLADPSSNPSWLR